MDVATFGSTCSPCSAQYVKNLNASEFSAEYPEAAAAIIKKHYVDDYYDSVDTTEEAVRRAKEVRFIHAMAGFEIRNWASNSPEVLESLGEQKPVQAVHFNFEKATKNERVLGIIWNPSEDVFSFATDHRPELIPFLECAQQPTKRLVLSCVMGFFEPLGLLAPFTIHGKMLVQDLWRTGCDWDDEIDDESLKKWKRWTGKAVPFVELTVAHASVLTILAISFERYYAICEPLKAGYVCTKARALIICLAAWTVAAILTSPILLFAEYSVEQYPDGSRAAVCLTKASNVWTMTFFLMTISLFFMLPLIILVVLYAIIAKNLIASNNSRMKIRLSKPELSYKARKQVVLMLGAVVLAFFTCLLPFRMLTLWIIIVSEETFQKLGVEKYYNLLYFSRIMLYLNSAVNPILYNLMSSKFRKGFLRLCRCSRLWGHPLRRRAGKLRGRSATFTTTTTSSYLTSSSIRKSSEKYTLSLDDLRFQQLAASNGLLRSANCDGSANPPASGGGRDAASNGVVVVSDDEEPFQLSRFYRVNLLRQYSTPLLACYEEGSGDLRGRTLLPSVGTTGINNNKSAESAVKRQYNVTFGETDRGNNGLAAGANGEVVLERARSNPFNLWKLKFIWQQPQLENRQHSHVAHGGGRVAGPMKQMSLDESLLATRENRCMAGGGVGSDEV